MSAAVYLARGHESRLIDLAQLRGLDGVICGHYHLADINTDHGLTYANCGDWMDSYTALAEDFDGKLGILHSGATRASPSDWADVGPQYAAEAT